MPNAKFALTMTGAFGLFQLCILTLLPTLGSSSPPLDVVEGWLWAPHWLLGTYKHPPMPAWTMEALYALIPAPVFGPYLLSQLAIAITYLLVFLIGARLMDRGRAAAGTLLLAGSFYFTVSTIEYNHNVLQMPVWAAIIYVVARLRARPSSWWLWLLLGCIGGFGLYVKYEVAVLLAAVVVYSFMDRSLRGQYLTPRPYVAAILALLLFAPHAKWLVDSGFQPFGYAAKRAAHASSPWRPFGFLATQVADHLAMLVLLAIAGIRTIRRGEPAGVASGDMLLLRFMTFGPLLITVAAGIALQAGLRDMWGMPMFTTAGLWAVAEIGRHWPRAALMRLTAAAMAIVLVVAIALAALPSLRDKKPRTGWPAEEIARQAGALWQARVGTPLALVGGDDWWLPGLVAIDHPSRPSVIIGDDLSRSPWVSPEDVRTKGVLYLSQSGSAAPAYCASETLPEPIVLGPGFPAVIAAICWPSQAP